MDEIRLWRETTDIGTQPPTLTVKKVECKLIYYDPKLQFRSAIVLNGIFIYREDREREWLAGAFLVRTERVGFRWMEEHRNGNTKIP